MARKYLILGASSDLAMEFLKTQDFSAEDEAILQYRCPNMELEQFATAHAFRMEQADFSAMESTQKFVNRLKMQKYIPTHILHVPAIPVENKRFTEYVWQECEDQFHVQVRSLFLVLQAVIKGMVKGKQGKIVLVLTSYTKAVPPKFLASYVMSKYALLGFGKAIAAEYAGKGILVNMVSPSMVETKFLANVYGGAVEQSAMANPMGRNAKVQDVVPLIKYLLSDENKFVTGANIPVTGGEVF